MKSKKETVDQLFGNIMRWIRFQYNQANSIERLKELSEYKIYNPQKVDEICHFQGYGF